MRWSLLWQPAALCERVAYRARQRRRLRRLRGTVADALAVGHIESLELLEFVRPLGIRSIYDVGAHVGQWTLLARAVLPDAEVEAFEPLPQHCREFAQNTRGVERVRLHPVALGASNGEALLRVTDFSDASSILPLAEPAMTQFGLAETDRVPVTMHRLDDYRARQGLAAPDLIKLDVQGYEGEVLAGARDCLRHVKAVVIEVSFLEYYERQVSFHELVAIFADCGLHLALLGDHTPTAEALKQTDMLFTRRDAGAGSP